MTDSKRIVRIGGMLLGTAATCIFAYLALRHVDFTRSQDGLARSNYAWLLPALLALVTTMWLRAVRWQLLFDPATRPSLRAVTMALLIGYFFNQLLPARAGEGCGRPRFAS